MKLSPIAAAGVGGGATGLALVAGRLAFDPAKAGTSKARMFVASHSAKIAWLVGLAASAATYAATKKKDAAIGSAVGATVVGLPAIILEVKASSDAKKAAAAMAAMSPGAGGTGYAVAEARHGFGAPPTVQLFGEAPRGVQLLGTPSQEGQASQYTPAAFGGGSF